MELATTLFERLKQSRLFTDSFWALLGSALGKGLAFLSGIIVARLLGSEVFGEYGLIRTTLTYIAIVSTFGFGYTATKFVAEYSANKPEKLRGLIKGIVGITLIFSLILSLIQAVFAKQIAIFVDAPHLESTIRNFAILTIFNAITTSQIAILAGLKEFKTTAKINGIAGLSTFVLSAILTYYLGLNGALLALLASFIIQSIVSIIAIRCAIAQNSFNELVERKEYVSMLKFSTPIVLQDSLYAITHWTSTYIIILLAGYSEVGMLSAAVIWQSMVIFIPAMLKNVMFSYLAVNTSSTNDTGLVKRFLQINALCTTLPVVIIILLSKVIEGVYGPTFLGLQYIIIVVCISAIFISLGEVYTYELIARNRPWMVFIARLIREIATLFVAYLLLLNAQSNQALTYSVVALGFNIIYTIVVRGLYKHQHANV